MNGAASGRHLGPHGSGTDVGEGRVSQLLWDWAIPPALQVLLGCRPRRGGSFRLHVCQRGEALAPRLSRPDRLADVPRWPLPDLARTVAKDI